MHKKVSLLEIKSKIGYPKSYSNINEPSFTFHNLSIPNSSPVAFRKQKI